MPLTPSVPTITLPPVSFVPPSPEKPRSRARSSSIVEVQQVGEDTLEAELDKGAFPNVNSQWVNGKGAWIIHPLLIFVGKMIVDLIPGMTQQASWTIANLGYAAISYVIFHYFTGIPFQSELHAGAYDDLTLWEQIDEGAQYTPAKKWLVCVPVGLFLVSTHFTHYDLSLFAINVTALIFVLFPKLPQLHRQRVRILPAPDYTSGMVTPVSPTSVPPNVPRIEVPKSL
jgi:hypothetical protein